MTPYEPEESPDNEVEPEEITEIADIETIKQALAEEKNKTEEYLANWQRAQADFINYKRRTEQARDELNKFANAALILGLLPVLDDLERALNSVPPRTKAGWTDGIRLIERNFRSTLEAQGLNPIKALGEPFDPKFHEAIRQDKGKEGIVVGELQKGYTLGDKVLRPAKVVVGNGEEAAKEDS